MVRPSIFAPDTAHPACETFYSCATRRFGTKQAKLKRSKKAPFFVIRRIRNAILDEIFKPGDRLREEDLAERFKVSRSPVREALLALENEGTVIMAPLGTPAAKVGVAPEYTGRDFRVTSMPFLPG